jgi:hypothetical protein
MAPWEQRIELEARRAKEKEKKSGRSRQDMYGGI